MGIFGRVEGSPVIRCLHAKVPMSHPTPRTLQTHPAHFLAGMTLASGWEVLTPVGSAAPVHEGQHSVGYFVQHRDGREGFLKVIDLSDVYQAPNVMLELQLVSAQFNFEVKLLDICRDLRMHRVVRAMDHGEERLPGILVPVPYIVFDRAAGDIRDHLAMTTIDSVWLLHCVHHVAVGLQQLHGARYAHNDLKPANILVFPGDGWKIGDLGRAVDARGTSPHHEHLFSGTMEYAPPEVLYFAPSTEVWRERKWADLYMLGGLVTFLFTHQHFNTYLYDELDEPLQPIIFCGEWEGSFEDLLPHLLGAFGRAMRTVERELVARVGPELAPELARCIRELCCPEPARRGHPSNVGTLDPTSVQRHVSLFDLLRQRALLAQRRAR